MARHPHLVRRDGVFYWRRRVPHDLRTQIGRAQLVKSLFTSDRHHACQLSRRLDVAMDRVFSMARTMQLTVEQLQALTNEMIRLEREQLEHERIDFPDLTIEKSRLASTFSTDMSAAMKTHLMSNDFSTIAPLMCEVLDRHKLDVPVGSYGWKQLGRHALRGLAQVYNVDSMRWLGEYEEDERVPLPTAAAWTSVSPAPPLAGAAPSSPAPTPATSKTEKTVSAYIEQYVEEARHTGQWTNQTEAQNRNSIDLLIRICGDKLPSTYTRDDAATLRRRLEMIPENYGKSPRHKAMTMDEVIAAKKPETKTLSEGTLNRHWNSITGYFRWLNRQDGVPDLSLERVWAGFRWGANIPTSEKRLPWDIPSLEKLFASPIWTGFEEHPTKRHWRHRPGTTIIRDEYFWLPILALFGGGRCDENAQLTGRDIFQVDGIWAMHFRGPHLKTEASERIVPVHSTLISLGFLDLARKAGEGRLFPKMIPGGRDQKFSHFYSEEFTDYRRRIGVYKELMDYHSFRTSATSAMIHENVPLLIADEITGHDSAGRKDAKETQTVTLQYVSPFPMDKLKEAIETIKYPPIDWSRLAPKSQS
jgi:Phage integrase family.